MRSGADPVEMLESEEFSVVSFLLKRADIFCKDEGSKKKCQKASQMPYFMIGGHCLFLLLTWEVILRTGASVDAGTKAALVLL